MFSEDFINSRTYHDSEDAASKNDHMVILGRIRTLLQHEEIVKRYSKKHHTMENFYSCMEDLLIREQTAERSTAIDFQCDFTPSTISVITEAANSIHLFTADVTEDDMHRLFNECRPKAFPALRSNNNQFIAYFFASMDGKGLVAHNYQKVIDTNRLIQAPKSDRWLTAHNLACALSQINAVRNPIKSKIDGWVKRIEESTFLNNEKQ